MDNNKTMSISEGRKRIFEILEEVQKPGVHYTFTEKGKSKGVLMSAEEFDSLQETLEILSDPMIAKKIELAEAEYQRGNYVTWSEFKKELHAKDRANIVADKSSKKYRAGKK